MTSALLTVLGALGSIASIVSLVLYLYDKKKSAVCHQQTAYGLRTKFSAKQAHMFVATVGFPPRGGACYQRASPCSFIIDQLFPNVKV